MALGLTQPLIEMSTRNLPGGKRQPGFKDDNLKVSVSGLSRNLEASMTHKPMGLYGLLYLFILPSFFMFLNFDTPITS
jgi:hypothetical protein